MTTTSKTRSNEGEAECRPGSMGQGAITVHLDNYLMLETRLETVYESMDVMWRLLTQEERDWINERTELMGPPGPAATHPLAITYGGTDGT